MSGMLDVPAKHQIVLAYTVVLGGLMVVGAFTWAAINCGSAPGRFVAGTAVVLCGLFWFIRGGKYGATVDKGAMRFSLESPAAGPVQQIPEGKSIPREGAFK